MLKWLVQWTLWIYNNMSRPISSPSEYPNWFHLYKFFLWFGVLLLLWFWWSSIFILWTDYDYMVVLKQKNQCKEKWLLFFLFKTHGLYLYMICMQRIETLLQSDLHWFSSKKKSDRKVSFETWRNGKV